MCSQKVTKTELSLSASSITQEACRRTSPVQARCHFLHLGLHWQGVGAKVQSLTIPTRFAYVRPSS